MLAWAAFASVPVQRRDKQRSRLRDDQLGYAAPSGERAAGGAEVGRFVLDRMDEMIVLIKHVEDFMLTPAFAGVFGEPGDESSADAEGIVHTVNRRMDYHDRFLGMVERCRGLGGLQRICAAAGRSGATLGRPGRRYRTFIDDFVDRVQEIPAMLQYAHGTIALDPVVLHMDVEDGLIRRIRLQLNAIAAH
ncbi:hypothetical protein [Mycobacterium sp. HUMS_1102779]|uniref:hypothetical protein n=1 Tax=Mycobacterium sp. HUMS_1102779 TaxID=3383487 RepID=UPI003899F8FF